MAISFKWRTATVVAAMATAAALTLSACAGGGGAPQPSKDSAEGKPVKGGNLTVAINDDPRSLDTVALPGVTAAMISEMVFEQLFIVDKTNAPRPMLVDKYTVSDDKLTYDFTLRSGIKFHDDTPFTANDAVESLKYWMRVANPGKLVSADVASIETKGDNELVITLNKPRYPLIAELGGPGPIMMKAATAEAGTPQGFVPDQAIGTGPYKVKEWNGGQEIVIERYDGYKSRTEEDWGGMAGAKHAYLDTITYKIVTDDDARVNGLITGQWQHAMPGDNQYAALKGNPDVTVATLFGGNPNVIIPNFNEGSIFSKVEAREALNLIMDKKALVAVTGADPDITIMDGAFVTPDNKPMYSKAGADVYKAHDPEKAKKLFEQAGLKSGDSLRIVTSSSFPQFSQWSVELQQEFKKIGVDVKIDTYDFTTMLGVLREQASDWDLTTLFFNGALTSPEQIPALTLGGLNGSGSPEMTKLLAQYNSSSDEAGAHKIIDKLQAQVWKEYPVVAINSSKIWAAYSPKLKGYNDYRRIFWNAWLEK